ncbi:uncharacterized protein LOC110373177 isoform X1 [Helicoverpa armigera]|uniref:uncharacterized protein LOC110373177 isoform X1 n=1 Tax=Helicoverpa armigera TaxID=29058 RepID=UPI0030836F41
METNSNDTCDEETLLLNSLLFNAIRKNKRPEEKTAKISKYLSLGADINAVDANNKNNTPLHVAVLKGEIEVVKYLLEHGANASYKNGFNQTALDIAQQLEPTKGTVIINILKSDNDVYQEESQKQTPTITKQINKFQTQSYNTEGIKGTKEHFYQKRSGTSGLGGQLYETKLLTLVLLRALHTDSITDFYLGTNVEGVGAFDDIVLRYNAKGNKKPKVIFLQAKHRENPIKDEVTIAEVMKQNGDFSLDKYLESYLKIIRKFSLDNDDNMFKGSIEDIDSEFIIFTSALENFDKKKMIVQNDEEDFIRTVSNGKIFQYDYSEEDIELLVQAISRSRAVALAKRLCQFIFKENNNYKNMMMDDFIKTFHVFLAQNLIRLESSETTKEAYYLGTFHQDFLNTDDDLLLLMKHTICREIPDTMKTESGIESLTFKLPINFGNTNFSFSGSEAKKQRRLNYLCTTFQKLVDVGVEIDNNYIVIKIDDNMIGPNKVLQDTDVETYRLGGLIGNLLIFDNVSKLLKFNLDESSLSEDNVKLLELLKDRLYNLSQLRFDFKTNRLPKLTLSEKESDGKVVQTFLDKLKFYTNQGKEDEVENIVKMEIDKYCNIKQHQNETLFRIKCDAIFLKVHDKIQKWWKRSVRAPYLTATCKFYREAQKDILDSPLLSFLNVIYRESMKNILARFVPVTIDSLNIGNFLTRDERIMFIFSNEISFSCIKLIQYFDEKDFEENCLFIDLDFVITENYFEIVQSELKKSKLEVLVVVFQNGATEAKIADKIKVLSHIFNGKIMVVTKTNLKGNLESVLSENIVEEIDTNNSLNDLIGEYREMILIERKILFQGDEMSLDTLLDSESLHFVKANVLRKIIDKETIGIGKTLTNPSYNTIANFYINQGVCRFITMDLRKNIDADLFLIDTEQSHCLSVPQGITDVILVANSHQNFDDVCNSNKMCNIHWFRSEGSHYVWKKSRGSIEVLLRYITRGSHNDYIVHPRTLKDISDKTVIINAEPGMGKSTLLTHLAIQTKRTYPKLWIAKINLLEYTDQFSKWKEDETNLNNMVEAIKFLYNAITTNYEKEHETSAKKIKSYFEELVNQVSVDSDHNIYLQNRDSITQNESCDLGLLEISLFSYYYNNNLVALLFDGFDEICPDYANEVIQLLRTLKNSKVAHLWVTTRSYNVLNQLERALGTFSFSLQALNPYDQETFLERIWSSKLGLEDAVGIRNGVNKFFDIISIALRDDERTFTSIPLHLNMVSEIFLDFFRFYYNPNVEKFSDEYIEHIMKTFNLISLYETFVDIKFFKIRFGEKKHFMCFKDPDMRKVVEKERKAFLDNHKKIGAYFLLAKSVVKDLFSEQEIKEVLEFLNHIKSGEEKSGIIERIVDDDPKFVHITFAEYFATEFLFDKFKSDTCTLALQRYVLNLIFLTNKGGVRRFINSKLIKDKKLFDLSNDTTHICEIFDTLLSQNYLPSNSFFVAGEEYLDHIAMYMLICASTAVKMKTVNKFIRLFRKKCNNFCQLCAAKDRKLKIDPAMFRTMGSKLRW